MCDPSVFFCPPEAGEPIPDPGRQQDILFPKTYFLFPGVLERNLGNPVILMKQCRNIGRGGRSQSLLYDDFLFHDAVSFPNQANHTPNRTVRKPSSVGNVIYWAGVSFCTIDMNDEHPAIRYHLEHRGKIAMTVKSPLERAEDLALAYTPGVAEACRTIAAEPETVERLTNRANTVAIVTDGTAILGLGDIGPSAGLPVMEGKAMIFKHLADVDAVPLCIDATGIEDIVRFCKQIEPSFGGINLEDIAAPGCFEVLERLERELTIPVFHDDQDGTAIIVLAALINAAKVRGGETSELRAVINGAGAAGIAIARLMLAHGIGDVVLVDSKGIVSTDRNDLNGSKSDIASRTNPRKLSGNLATALSGADIFVGVSKGNILDRNDIRTMAERPIVFAMSNPDPEILPDEAIAGGAFIVGTGRSDFPNQINNALVFPGIFRGLLDARFDDPSRPMAKVSDSLKLAVAKAVAGTVEPTVDRILPAVMDASVVPAVRTAVLAQDR